jgi:hypothetical protein
MAIIPAGRVEDAAPTKIIFSFELVPTFYVGMHTRTLRVQALVMRSVGTRIKPYVKLMFS